MIPPILIVHGGAGTWADDRVDAAIAGCQAAVRAGLASLKGGSAVDAVQAAVAALEEDPLYNAGIGSVLTRAQTVEVDAAIMDGAGRRFGAIAAMPDVRHPIALARAVLDDGEHVLLAGPEAWRFARGLGIEPCDPALLITERSRQRHREMAQKRGDPAADPGTVGACAIDASGHVAAATSTGGIVYKRPGRVGDTPLCGCGTYADDRAGAASATGDGESIIRATMTRVCVDAMGRGASASKAAWHAVRELESSVPGTAGIICCDREGRIGAAHCSARMAWAAARVGGAVVGGVRLERDADVMASIESA